MSFFYREGSFFYMYEIAEGRQSDETHDVLYSSESKIAAIAPNLPAA